MAKTIDLGKSYSSPSEAEIAPKSESKNKVHYPTLYVSDVESMDSLPEGEFTFTGTAKVVSKTESTRGDKKSCSCELEIKSITPTKKESKSSTESLEEALDK